MGYLLCRVLRVYGLPYREMMGLPMRVFWQLSGNVPRLLSEERKESLHLAVTAAHNPEAAAELYERLDKQTPEPVTLTGYGKASINSVRDEEGLNDLRSMAG